MNAIESKINDVTVLFETIESVNIINGQYSAEGRQAKQTSTRDNISDIYSSLKEVISSVANDIGDRLSSLNSSSKPQKAVMEINLGLGGETNAWIFSGKADASIKLTLTWEERRNG